MPKKNDILTVEITDITGEGMGIGKADGYVLFVPACAVGDICEVKVLKALKNYGYAKIERIIKPSPERTETDCAVFGRCGGCTFRHISYSAELMIKKHWVDENFARIGALDIRCDAIVPSPEADGYRNKAQLPCGTGENGIFFGFYSKHSHRMIPCENCRLTPPFYEEIIACVERWASESGASAYDEESGRGLLRHLYIRDGRGSGEVMVCLVTNGRDIPEKQALIRDLLKLNICIKSIVLNINMRKTNEILGDECVTLYGSDTISDTLGGLKFDISPLSFYQVNRNGAERLYSLAGEFAALTGGETLLDLYCGAGTIGLFLSGKVKKLYGAEIIPQAVENARENAAKNGIENAGFFCADAGEAALMLSERGVRPDVIILDPPRKGINADVIEAIVRMQPERVVMVSCNSATAARDCALLAERGYVPAKLRALDMFPRTGHVECVCLLSKLNTNV